MSWLYFMVNGDSSESVKREGVQSPRLEQWLGFGTQRT